VIALYVEWTKRVCGVKDSGTKVVALKDFLLILSVKNPSEFPAKLIMFHKIRLQFLHMEIKKMQFCTVTNIAKAIH
jgi:hypothetical protein